MTERTRRLLMQFALSLAASVLAQGIGHVMLETPLGGKLEWISWAAYLSGALFGPMGVLATFLGYLLQIDSVSEIPYAASYGLAYASLALSAWLFHRFVPTLGRGPKDLRSYVGFIVSVVVGSAVLAAVGSAFMFPDAFAMAFSFWFTSAVTMLVIVAPLVLLETDRLLGRWIALPPDPTSEEAGVIARVSENARGLRLAPALVVTVGIPVGMILAAVAHFLPSVSEWILLVYLLPVMWSAINFGLRGGVLAASASGVLLLTGAAVMEFLSPSGTAQTHPTVSFAVPILLSVVGAAAGAFQTERERMVADLEMAESRLRRASHVEALGLLAGGIAHDFNNLLTVIGGNAAMARVQSAEESASYRIARDIEKAVESASSLTRQLVAFSRQQELAPKLIDLNQIVQSQAGLLERLIGSRIRVETRLWETPVMIRADPAQIGRAILNLGVNARDAMPRGGQLDIEVAIAELDEEGKRRIDVGDVGSLARLAVADTGVGMGKEVLEKIFEPFFTTKEAEGTGLGLTTVSGIVRQSTGWVDVTSTLGEGTRFELFFPLAEPN